ncbi:DNA-formamidopyrimidine glycosylase [Pelotomaculum terephthalicicum JT]|uniref:DNA-formamidopyrimidine glycosylase n=1 Tax=Pelotomaculum TaxID=191373 RepID=UPI0009C4EAD7|nr:MULTISPECIES: DNA-formamidopyrimidine glycosylase [Pelotomaculum]MCG9969382.1 DNA-formamidopyrimidine glycosylase [Pelotomaculum terephthalicicum JT]OPX87599.1 MAG: Formamidopyrimidine-DNA glycosylase [Pelotomaculum sp. PtaB.Bin117]OPY60669.1 MAG: Formamidopyrimidine-DNA glycosylase [Pelotomaculum sp. PtaU1.Bin065]
MPELPEVETIMRTLQPKLTGLKFIDAQIMLPKIIRTPDIDEFKEKITGKKILKINRRGKYLLFILSDGLNLVFHLRMTGSLVYCQQNESLSKYTHIILVLNNGFHLRYADMRQFGRIWLLPASSMNDLTGYKNLGIEPLEAVFTLSYLKKELKRRHVRIKSLLLDQTFIAGLGNIYTDEVLHRAEINPERLANTLTPREITRLYHAVRDVLQEGIENRGTTVRDFIDGNGRPGGYQKLLRVYHREGKPCRCCGQNIVRKKIGGRSTYFCPACQKI